jgi:hypothetical protein
MIGNQYPKYGYCDVRVLRIKHPEPETDHPTPYIVQMYTAKPAISLLGVIIKTRGKISKLMKGAE